jgi:hypothetical protein
MASATSSSVEMVTVQGSGRGTVDVGTNGTLTVGRVMFSDGAVLEKSGTGTMVISGAINGTAGTVATEFTNSALNVTGGKLIYNSTSTVVEEGTGIVAALANGTVGGTGMVPTLQAASGGTIAPGVDGAGTLNVQAGLILASESKLAIEIGTLVSSDVLNVKGDVTVGGAILQLSLLPQFNMTQGDLFFVMLNDGTDTIKGIFSGIANNSTITLGGAQFRALYTANSETNSATNGNDFALQALNTIPEPSAFISLLGGLGTLVGLRRFRPRARQ